jgi:hypothetical protein
MFPVFGGVLSHHSFLLTAHLQRDLFEGLTVGLLGTVLKNNICRFDEMSNSEQRDSSRLLSQKASMIF